MDLVPLYEGKYLSLILYKSILRWDIYTHFCLLCYCAFPAYTPRVYTCGNKLGM